MAEVSLDFYPVPHHLIHWPCFPVQKIGRMMQESKLFPQTNRLTKTVGAVLMGMQRAVEVHGHRADIIM